MPLGKSIIVGMKAGPNTGLIGDISKSKYGTRGPACKGRNGEACKGRYGEAPTVRYGAKSETGTMLMPTLFLISSL